MEEKFYDRLIFISVYRATDNGFTTFISSNVSKFRSKNPQSLRRNWNLNRLKYKQESTERPFAFRLRIYVEIVWPLLEYGADCLPSLLI